MSEIAVAIDKVRSALQREKFPWRTLRGIAKETGLSLADVQNSLQAMGGDVTKSPVRSETGEDLYTLTERYLKQKPGVPEVHKVIEALEDPKFPWRTVKGLVAATGLSEAAVLEIINANRDHIIQSETPATTGEALFTTRKHFIAKSGPLGQMLGFFRARLS